VTADVHAHATIYPGPRDVTAHVSDLGKYLSQTAYLLDRDYHIRADYEPDPDRVIFGGAIALRLGAVNGPSLMYPTPFVIDLDAAGAIQLAEQLIRAAEQFLIQEPKTAEELLQRIATTKAEHEARQGGARSCRQGGTRGRRQETRGRRQETRGRRQETRSRRGKEGRR
jgi:hypothetical protein